MLFLFAVMIVYQFKGGRHDAYLIVRPWLLASGGVIVLGFLVQWFFLRCPMCHQQLGIATRLNLFRLMQRIKCCPYCGINFDKDHWDAQLERDVAAGRLDALADEAKSDFDAGRSREI